MDIYDTRKTDKNEHSTFRTEIKNIQETKKLNERLGLGKFSLLMDVFI